MQQNVHVIFYVYVIFYVILYVYIALYIWGLPTFNIHQC